MISTPQTGVDSVLVAAAFLGWPFALFKIAAAALTGMVGGLLTESIGGERKPYADASAPHSHHSETGFAAFWAHSEGI